jgi:16S rRNA (cytosine967-C5)-methyltransferase
VSVEAGQTQDRVRAARVLLEIIYNHKTLDQTFDYAHASALQRELVYGTLRHYFSLEKLVHDQLSRALRSKDLDLRCLMLVGAYQLHFMRIPDHAAINETVSACRSLRKPWARSLVNAVLRKVAEGTLPDLAERSFELPVWMVEKISAQYSDGDLIMAATLNRAPMSLRVNASKLSPQEYAEKLTQAEIRYFTGWQAENLLLAAPVPARDLPGHEEGLVSIQDAGALFASHLIAESAPPSTPPSRILDACAAPGGKLFHIVEQADDATVVGLEISDSRLEHLIKEASRLGHLEDLTLLKADARQLDWYDGTPYDAILVDAPCSGSGTLRRHPDIKILRQESDLSSYAAVQKELLANLWQTLAPGGTLLYCTCSIFREENDAVVAAHLAATADAELLPFELPTGRATEHGWQLVPLPHQSPAQQSSAQQSEPAQPTPDKSVDGFYFARMTRRRKAR